VTVIDCSQTPEGSWNTKFC